MFKIIYFVFFFFLYIHQMDFECKCCIIEVNKNDMTNTRIDLVLST